MIAAWGRQTVTLWPWGLPSPGVVITLPSQTTENFARGRKVISPALTAAPDVLTGWLLLAAMLWAALETMWRR